MDDLHSRVRNLEGKSGMQRPSSAESPELGLTDTTTTRRNPHLPAIAPTSQDMGQDRSSGDEVARMATGYQGPTSPWTTLVNGTSPSSGSESMRSFQETAERLAKEEILNRIYPTPIRFDILHEFPFLTRDRLFAYAENYAVAAPFPILHWESFRNSLDRILKTRQVGRSGQIVCILIVNSLCPLNFNLFSTLLFG